MCEQIHRFDEALKIRGKKFRQNLRENCSKSTKIAIAVGKFSKILRGSMPPDLHIRFCSAIPFKFILPEKIRLKMSKFDTPVPKKISEYAPDVKPFQRAYLRSFAGLND